MLWDQNAPTDGLGYTSDLARHEFSASTQSRPPLPVAHGLHSRTAQGSGGLKTCVPNIVSGIDDCMYFRSSRNPFTAVLSSLEASNAHKSAQSSCLKLSCQEY